MSNYKLLAIAPFLIFGLAACGDDEVAERPTETTTAEAPVTTEAPAVAEAPAVTEAPATTEAPAAAAAPAPSGTDTTAPPPTVTAAAPPNAAPPATLTMPPANATAPAETTGAIGPMQRYVGRPFTSGPVSLRLDQGGQFELSQTEGNQKVTGQYTVANGVVTFQNPTGNVGNATFPMRCRLVEDGEGFRVEAAELSCTPLAGQTFRPAS